MPKKPTPQGKTILDGLRNHAAKDGGDVADWERASAEKIKRVVTVISARNGAVRFGYTRDGGAYSVGLYIGDDRETMYCRPYEDIDGLLDQIADGLEEFPIAAAPTPK